MMDTKTSPWTPWKPPDDPRLVDGVNVIQDERGRMIEFADCGQRCPGCGMCCSGYRDLVVENDRGIPEFELNLTAINMRKGLVKVNESILYHGASCNRDCPGYGRCCLPFEQRQRPQTLADSRRVLLEDMNAQRWEMQLALLQLAHDGSPTAIETLYEFQPLAHARLQGLVESALREGESVSDAQLSSVDDRRTAQQAVFDHYVSRAAMIQAEIEDEIEPELARLQYEIEIIQRLHDKAVNVQERDDWQIQLDILEMDIARSRDKKVERETDLRSIDKVLDEIRNDMKVQ
jgi:hypothetical protein